MIYLGFKIETASSYLNFLKLKHTYPFPVSLSMSFHLWCATDLLSDATTTDENYQNKNKSKNIATLGI